MNEGKLNLGPISSTYDEKINLNLKIRKLSFWWEIRVGLSSLFLCIHKSNFLILREILREE